MSITIIREKTLKNRAIITINDCTKNIDVSTNGDVTLIKSDDKLCGINIDNYNKYFKGEEGFHISSEEQKKFIDKYTDEKISSKFKVAKILEKNKHPKSDKLFLLKVIADKEYNFVTNVNKLEAGHNIVIALEGAYLPSGLVIRKNKIMGVESNQSLVGLKTLGISDNDEYYVDNVEVGNDFLF